MVSALCMLSGGYESPFHIFYWPLLGLVYIGTEKKNINSLMIFIAISYLTILLTQFTNINFPNHLTDIEKLKNFKLLTEIVSFFAMFGLAKAAFSVGKAQQIKAHQKEELTLSKAEKTLFALNSYAKGDFDYEIADINEHDIFDAISQGVKTLGDYLKDSVVSKDSLNEVLDSTGLCIMLVDKENHITYYNSTSEAVFGKIKLMSMDNIIPSFDKELSNGLIQDLELKNLYDENFHAKVTINKISDEKEDYVIVIEDITEIKIAESEKEELNLQLVQAGKLASLGTLVAGICHEINNPLTIIKLSKDQIAKKNLDEVKMDRNLSRMERQIDRIDKIVNNLRRFSRDQKDADVEMIDFNKTLEETLQLFTSRIDVAEVRLDVSLEPNLIFVGNSVNIESVFQNFFTNTLDAFEERNHIQKREISVIGLLDDGEVVIVYQDTAGGIPPEHVDKIMDPFFTTKPVGKGTGLGMSISKSIIEDHGGTIDLNSEWEKGTTITIRLPRTEAQKVAS
jgi:signal transduction histidine kinase